MNRHRLRLSLLVVCAPLLLGFVLPQCGGLKSVDFERISLNGFDPVDEAQDKNSYAWAMDYFLPDGAQDGHLYVGTGNNLGGLLAYGVMAVVNGEDPREGAPIRPPEIRRYRPGLGPMEWERVLDYRDIESDPNWRTIGFRYMTTYRAKNDGVNYLYAASMGAVPALWRSASGNPGDWELVLEFDTGSIRWMEEHQGLLYLSLATDIPGTDLVRIGRIWATDGDTVWPVIEDGFGNPDNIEVECLTSYNGWLYAGTLNQSTGYEVWKLAGPNGDEPPVQIVANGGPDPRNDIAGTPKIFKGKLYIGSLIFQGGFNVETLNGFKGCDIIRIDENDHWETVVGKNSISGYDSGFNHFTNAYLWWMEEHDGWLYASTYDQAAMLQPLVEYLPELIPALINGELGDLLDDSAFEKRSLLEWLFNSGCDLYKSEDGIHWGEVFQNGLGNPNNYGIRTMKSIGSYLYLGTANNNEGLEIWRGMPKDGAAAELDTAE